MGNHSVAAFVSENARCQTCRTAHS